MTVVHIIGWSMVAAVISWRLAWHRARAIFDRALAHAHAESRHMRAEADRWRTSSIRLSKEIAAWKAGHQEGRADVVSIVPMLIEARQSSAAWQNSTARQNSAACNCTADDQISSGM